MENGRLIPGGAHEARHEAEAPLDARLYLPQPGALRRPKRAPRKPVGWVMAHEAIRHMVARRSQVTTLALVVAILGWGTGGSSSAQSPPAGPLAANRVVSVYDGDTLHLNRGGAIVTVRLVGPDAPELRPKQPGGPEAADYLKGWLVGKVVRVSYETGQPRHDRYGRLLAYLWADGGRQLVNAVLVEKGFARYDRRFPTMYRAEFEAAEARAKAAGLGIWARPSTSASAGPRAILASWAPDRPVWRRSAGLPEDVGPRVPPALMDRTWNPPPPRPPGWAGHWPPDQFTGLDECLDCLEHLLKITGYGEKWTVRDE
jgi:micrococcal nuclease